VKLRKSTIFLFMAIALLPVFGAAPARINKVGKAPNFIALSRDGSKAYVTSFADGRFLEVNLERRVVSRSVILGGSPLGFALSEAENLALIALKYIHKNPDEADTVYPDREELITALFGAGFRQVIIQEMNTPTTMRPGVFSLIAATK